MLRCTLPLPLILLLNVAVARLLYELVEEILALPGQDGLHSLIQDVLASTGTAENATITLETSVDGTASASSATTSPRIRENDPLHSG